MAGSMPAVVPLVAGLCPTPSTSAASLPGPGSKADGSGGGADVVARVTLEVFAFEIIRAMELTTILNLCHHHRGFVYYHARFGSDKKSVEVNIRPRAARGATSRRRVTIIFPNGASNSSPSGGFWSFSCTACGASSAAIVAWW